MSNDMDRAGGPAEVLLKYPWLEITVDQLTCTRCKTDLWIIERSVESSDLYLQTEPDDIHQGKPELVDGDTLVVCACTAQRPDVVTPAWKAIDVVDAMLALLIDARACNHTIDLTVPPKLEAVRAELLGKLHFTYDIDFERYS